MSKRPIEIYTHKDKKRLNNPPVGLVTPETDRETGKKAYTWAMTINGTLCRARHNVRLIVVAHAPSG
jgi:hypothetical protein